MPPSFHNRFFFLVILIVAPAQLLAEQRKELAATGPRTRLSGSGASTVAFLFTYLTDRINAKYGVDITYNPDGSGEGKAQFIGSAVEFAATGTPMSSQEELQLKVQGTVKFTLPFVIETYNIFTSFPGNPPLKFDALILALIYRGIITTWDNALILRLNPVLVGKVPKGRPIIPVARSDSSASTYIFTEYLYKAASSSWTYGYSELMTWPTSRIVKAPGTAGIAAVLKRTPYALTYAGTGAALSLGLQECWVQNKAGYYIKSSVGNVEAAIPITTPPSSASWASVSLLLAPGASTVPMVTFDYLLARANQEQSGVTGTLLKGWLTYLMSSGVQAIVAPYHFTPLPSSIIAKNVAALKFMKTGPGLSVPVFN
jgi:phosphate transport system substrate-binding protein